MSGETPDSSDDFVDLAGALVRRETRAIRKMQEAAGIKRTAFALAIGDELCALNSFVAYATGFVRCCVPEIKRLLAEAVEGTETHSIYLHKLRLAVKVGEELERINDALTHLGS